MIGFHSSHHPGAKASDAINTSVWRSTDVLKISDIDWRFGDILRIFAIFLECVVKFNTVFF